MYGKKKYYKWYKFIQYIFLKPLHNLTEVKTHGDD